MTIIDSYRTELPTGGAQSAPAFTAAPVMLGTPTVGTPVAFTTGTATGAPTPSLSPQWLLDGSPISGATSATYTPISGDATHTLSVRQTATNAAGSDASTSNSATVSAGVTTPTLVSSTIDSAGTTLTRIFSQSVTHGAGGSGGSTITASGGAATLTFSSGAGTTTLTYTISRAIQQSETATDAYTQPGNGIEGVVGALDVASFSAHAVTNNSVQGAVGGASPVLTALSSYGADVGSGAQSLTATGTGFQSGDQIEVWGVALTTTFVSPTSLTATVPSGNFTTANFGTCCVRRTSTNKSFCLPFESSPVQTAANNYTVGLTNIATPTYGGTGSAGTHPTKGTLVTQTNTGASVQRISDTSEVTGTPTALRVIYSKWSSINATGQYMFVEIEDSATCHLYRISDQTYLGKITGCSTPNGSFGENQEPRWSTRGDEPTTVYYLGHGAGATNGLGGKALYKKDIVNNTAEVLVKDFTTLLSLASDEFVYCDSEGTPSMDMRYWAFMRRNDTYTTLAELLTYDVLTDTTVRCKSATTSGFVTINATGNISSTNRFTSRPNWVSMSPRGDRIQCGWSRCYTGNSNIPDAAFGSDCDTPHTYKSADFSDSRPCCVDETHGGWAWSVGSGGVLQQAWISENNRNDGIDATLDISATTFASFWSSRPNITSQTPLAANPGTNGRQRLAELSGNWNASYADTKQGVHFPWQMSGRKAGFVWCSTNGNHMAGAYAGNSIFSFRLSDARMWRAAVLPHNDFDYFSEVQWAIDPFGITSHGHLNWCDEAHTSAHNEAYIVRFDSTWNTNAIWA